VLPAGDLDVFDDLGLDAMELGAILSDVDAYADEMLSTLARRLGFADAFERVVDALV
jgi:putative tRNA adenosine deaminase-associated protein